MAKFSSGARQWAGEIVVVERTMVQGAGGQEGADGRGDGAGQLVGVEAHAAMGARGHDHTKKGRQRRSQIH